MRQIFAARKMGSTDLDNSRHPFALLALGVFGISLSAIFVRYSQAPSGVTASWRLLWTSLLLSPALLASRSCRHELRTIPPRLLLLCAVSGLALALHFVTWFESLALTSVASSTVIVCTEVVWVALGWFLLRRGRLRAKEACAVAAALLGSFLVARADLSGGGASGLRGDLLSLFSAIVLACHTLLGSEARKSLSTMTYTWIIYLFCTAALLLNTLLRGESLTGYGMSPVIAGVLLAFFSTLLGHSIFSRCLKFFSPTFVSATRLCEPVVATILAALLFREVPSAGSLWGGLLVIGGVLAYSRAEKERISGEGEV